MADQIKPKEKSGKKKEGEHTISCIARSPFFCAGAAVLFFFRQLRLFSQLPPAEDRDVMSFAFRPSAL